MFKFLKVDRRPTFSDLDKENIGWFWTSYLRPKAKWMLVVFALVFVQGIAFQQFLELSENGLRTIFEDGGTDQLAWVCAGVFILFAIRGAASYITAVMSAWIAADAVAASPS